MPRTLPTSPSSSSNPTFGEMFEEVIDLTTGLGVALLPLLVLAVPSVVLFVLLPALLLLALALPFVLIGALLAAPWLLARWLRRRRTTSPPAGAGENALGAPAPGQAGLRGAAADST